MRILITGGCGFVGSSLALDLNTTENIIYVVDNLYRRGSELNLIELKNANIEFIHADVRIKSDVLALPEVDLVIDTSAEPAVLAGVEKFSSYPIETNLIGTINLLEYCVVKKSKFIFLSTSRVYSYEALCNIQKEEFETRFKYLVKDSTIGFGVNGINENFDVLGKKSVYGASKLCSEQLINEYNETYGLSSIINRCGVLAGPRQMGKVDQGFVVLWLAQHYFKTKLKYIGFGGKGKQVRDVFHIKDLVSLIEYQIKNFEDFENQTFNVGGGEETSVSLLELTGICEQITGNKIEISSDKINRVADIPIFFMDTKKIEKLYPHLKEKKSVFEISLDIFHWIKKNEKDLEKILKL